MYMFSLHPVVVLYKPTSAFLPTILVWIYLYNRYTFYLYRRYGYTYTTGIPFTYTGAMDIPLQQEYLLPIQRPWPFPPGLFF